MPSKDGDAAAVLDQTPAAVDPTGASETDDLLASLEADDSASSETGDGAAEAEDTDAETDIDRQSDDSDEQGSHPAEDEEKEGDERPKRDRVQERIDKLSAKAKAAEERAAAAEKKLEEATSGKKPESGFDPLEDEPQIRDLAGKADKARREIETARNLRRELRKDPDKVVALLQAKGVQVEDADAASDWLADYEDGQRDRHDEARNALGEARTQLKEVVAKQRRSWDAAAESRYAWLADEGDSRHELIRTAETNYPWVKKLPMARAVLATLADMVHEAKAPKGKPAVRAQGEVRRPTVQPSSGGNGAPVRRPGGISDKATRLRELSARLDANPGDDDAMAELLEQGLG